MLAAALERLEQERLEAAGGGGVARKPKPAEELQASDLFNALDSFEHGAEADGELTMVEVERLFASFDLDVTEGERDLFFSICDVDVDHKLSADEFQAGWDAMMREKLRASLMTVGVSRGEAVAATLVAVVIMILLATFIVMGINAFTTANGFIATVQSLLITATSMAIGSSQRPRQRPSRAAPRSPGSSRRTTAKGE